ncbi:MAG: rhodanese-like domain-containing protein [Ruminococcus sp.]|nr:rhodanese-like domain-containing protein [Ruminococcus sp.]
MKWYLILPAAVVLAVCIAFALFGCARSSDTASLNYTQVSSEEGQKMIQEETGYIILDVRRQDEYAEGHIPGAICVPNEEIGEEEIEELPDKDRRIFVYCRSGRRSKEAAKKLADMGYTDIVEFGGILDWKGEIEK